MSAMKPHRFWRPGSLLDILRMSFSSFKQNLHFVESLILAQDKRWRRALDMQVERTDFGRSVANG